MDLLGQTLEGGHAVQRLLAEGRHSQVYEAERRGAPRPVAVKVLHPTLADDPLHAARFRHEGEVLRRLRHRHAVALVESVQSPGGHCFHVLELLEGEQLRRRLDRDGPMPPQEVARLVKQAAGALQALHDLGVVHRDVEPGNLFLVGRPGASVELKLLDLGKALDLDQRQRRHEVVGTRGYMSPEQLRGEVHETAATSDLFALAVVAYEALCGGRPFEADDDELLYEITSGSFPSASGRVEGLPRQVDAVFTRALSPDRDQRHHSIETFADELSDAIDSDRVKAAERVGRDTARMAVVPAPEQPADQAAEPETGAQSPAPAEPPAAVTPAAPVKPAGPPAARVPVPPVPAVIPGLPLVDPSAGAGADASPGTEGAFVDDKTTVDAVPPATEPPLPTSPEPPAPAPQPVQPAPQPVQPAPQPVQQAPQPVQQAPQPVQPTPQPVQPAPQPVQQAAAPAQVQTAPYVPTPGATPYVPPTVPAPQGGSVAPTPAVTAAPRPVHATPTPASPPRSGGASAAMIVLFIVVGLVGLGLIVGLYLYLR